MKRVSDLPRLASVLISGIAALLGACALDPVPPATIYGAGLTQVEARHLDLAFVKDGVDFSRYDALIVSRPELAFRSAIGGEGGFPLSESQKASLVTVMAEELKREFEESQRLTLVSEPARDTLLLEVRIENIAVTERQGALGTVGRAAAFLAAVGEATLVLELRDSQSREMLAAAVDARAIEGVGYFEDRDVVTRWDDARELCTQWSIAARKALDTLVMPDGE